MRRYMIPDEECLPKYFADEPPTPPATTIERPTFAHALADCLTENGRLGDAPKVEAAIRKFMYDSEYVAYRAR